MARWRSSLLIFAVVLAASACAQAPRPTPPRSPMAAASRADASFRFAAYGDTRDQHDIHRDIVAKVMGSHPALVLQTGDLVHDGDDESQWQTFDEITGKMRQEIPYYPARGNHDVSAQGFYEQRVTQPVLSGNKLYYSFEKGNVHFIALDTEDKDKLAPKSAQREWLEADLAKAQSEGKFIIPFFHKAIFSIGPHAVDKNVVALRPILHPLFQKHGVRLAFLGHDHLYYRTVRDGITYVITGGGGAPLYDPVHRELGIAGDVFKKTHHFCIADVYPDRVTVTVYQPDLSRLDQFTVPMGGK